MYFESLIKNNLFLENKLFIRKYLIILQHSILTIFLQKFFCFFKFFLILKAQRIWTKTHLDYERTTVDYRTHRFFLQALQILTREYFLLRNFSFNYLFIHESEKNQIVKIFWPWSYFQVVFWSLFCYFLKCWRRFLHIKYVLTNLVKIRYLGRMLRKRNSQTRKG